ncbi:MAG: PAS domain-containing sensor histidine kinase [Jatrophihabitans sp.]|uniref:PAS domain-containing sensor histidine kinase n=1 Tax=Jatrophihabitans sp. TaxID=1932789 RepID=UPI003F81C2B9
MRPDTSGLGVGDMRAAIERVSDGMLLLDRSFVIRFVNGTGAAMLGTTPDLLQGRSLWETFPEGEGGTHEHHFRRAMSTLEPVVFERRLPRLSRTFDVRAYPSPEGLTVMFRDVTDWRRLERERERAIADLHTAVALRKQFEALVEASNDFIAIFDVAEGHHLQFLNPGGRRLIGLTADDDVTTIAAADLCDAETVAMIVESLTRTGQWAGEKLLRHQRTGAMIPVMAAHHLMHDPDTGDTIAFASVQRDISERRASERRLRDLAAHRRRLLERLVAAQEAERSAIAADVHDDSVQALAAVDLRLGILQRKVAEVAPEVLDQVKALQASVSEATSRLRHLLFDLESPGPDDTLASSLQSAAAHLFESDGVEWRLRGDLDADLPHTERIQALRIAKEALLNAARHAHASTVEIELVRRPDGVEIAVIDDGIGILPDVASPPGHRGLTTMRDRAEIAGGWWRLEPRSPRGTVVRFLLPDGAQD